MQDLNILIFLVFILFNNINADCDDDIQQYIEGLDLREPKLWSLEMLDSSVKYPQAGIFEGTFLVQLGNYDECLSVQGPNDDFGKPRFTGQYCLYNVGFQSAEFSRIKETLFDSIILRNNIEELAHRGSSRAANPITLPFLWSVCAPSSCKAEGVKKVADLNMNYFAAFLGVQANISVVPESCYFENDDSRTFNETTWAFIAFSSILAAWICFSSAFEYFNPEFKNEGWKLFVKSFSLQTNVGDLIKLPTSHAPGQLGCLHGIRVLSLMWVVLGHTYMFYSSFPISNFVSYRLKIQKEWAMAPIMNGLLSVDTFFVLSGLLVTYVPLTDHSRGRKFNVWKYYVYRYLRITPALAYVVWYLSSLNFYMGNGPLWYLTVGLSRDTCTQYWWPTLLYITNYFYYNCLGQAWYLCVDMQLALLAPIIIIPMIKWPKYAFGLLGLLTLASLAAMFGVTYVERFPWTLIMTGDITRYMTVFYINTPLRAVPYLIGMALGYLLSKKIKIPIPKWGIALGWLLSTATCLAIVYTIFIVYSDDYQYEPMGAAFYASMHKLGWSLGVGWVIWACVNGHGGVVNSILSWRYFVPLSKLTFSAYLVHQDIINFHRGLRRTPNYISHFEMFYAYSAFIILALPFSVLLYVAVEAPVMNLLRSAFRKNTANVATAKNTNKEK